MAKHPLMPMAAIQSGDLLAWSKDPYSTWGDLTLEAIRFFTRSEFGHVGIAWRNHDGLDDELFVIEATMPHVRIARVTTDRAFMCVPMGIQWSDDNKRFLVSKLGYPYGLLDALRAGLGLRVEHDMKWQCAELAHAFFEASGVVLKSEFTPGAVVKNAKAYAKTDVYRVVGPGKAISYDTMAHAS